MIVNLDDVDGNNVVSIETFRESQKEREWKKKCNHSSVIVDRSLTFIECKTCGKQLNPVEWILELADHWEHVRRRTEDLRNAIAEYDKRKRFKCRHCGQFSPV